MHSTNLVSTRTPPTVLTFFGALELELPMFPDSALLGDELLGGASCSGGLLLPFPVAGGSGAMAGFEKEGNASSSKSSSSSVNSLQKVKFGRTDTKLTCRDVLCCRSCRV